MGDDHSQKRAHFRIPYPSGEEPQVEINGKWNKVVDLSEKGLKITWEGKPLAESQKISGVVKFRDGKTVIIEGKVLRMELGKAILVLTKGIPLTKVMEEQRYLLKNYKSL